MTKLKLNSYQKIFEYFDKQQKMIEILSNNSLSSFHNFTPQSNNKNQSNETDPKSICSKTNSNNLFKKKLSTDDEIVEIASKRIFLDKTENDLKSKNNNCDVELEISKKNNLTLITETTPEINTENSNIINLSKSNDVINSPDQLLKALLKNNNTCATDLFNINENDNLKNNNTLSKDSEISIEKNIQQSDLVSGKENQNVNIIKESSLTNSNPVSQNQESNNTIVVSILESADEDITNKNNILENNNREPDSWDDYCYICNQGCDDTTGDLGCCSKCSRVFHNVCHIPKIFGQMSELP